MLIIYLYYQHNRFYFPTVYLLILLVLFSLLYGLNSKTITSFPEVLKLSAIAKPTAPAPITIVSTLKSFIKVFFRLIYDKIEEMLTVRAYCFALYGWNI